MTDPCDDKSVVRNTESPALIYMLTRTLIKKKGCPMNMVQSPTDSESETPYCVSTIAHSKQRIKGKESLVHVLKCTPHKGKVDLVTGVQLSKEETAFHLYAGEQIKQYHTQRDKTWELTTNGVIVSPFQHMLTINKKYNMVIVAVFQLPDRKCTFFVTIQNRDSQATVVIYAAHAPGELCLKQMEVDQFDTKVDNLLEEALARMKDYIPKHLRIAVALVDKFSIYWKRRQGGGGWRGHFKQ